MDTLFSLVDAALYAHLVELKDRRSHLLNEKVRSGIHLLGYIVFSVYYIVQQYLKYLAQVKKYYHPRGIN